MNKIVKKTFFVLMALTLGASNAIAMDYAVIINSNVNLNGDEEALKKQVQRVFLKQQTSWGNSIDAYPVGRRETDEAYPHFLTQVLKMNEDELTSYWLRFKQQEGQTPPRKIGTSNRLIKIVERNPGGVSFIAYKDAEELPQTVKVLFRF